MLVHSWYRCTIFVWIECSKYVCTFSWLIPWTELKKPRFIAASQVDFTGLKNVTFMKWIISSIVFCCYAEFSKCVDCCIGILQNLFLQSLHPFHATWWFLVTNTSLLVNKNLHPESQSGSIPIIGWYFRPVSMWSVMNSFGMYLTIILHSCDFFKVDHPAVSTLIGMVGGLLFDWLP